MVVLALSPCLSCGRPVGADCIFGSWDAEAKDVRDSLSSNGEHKGSNEEEYPMTVPRRRQPKQDSRYCQRLGRLASPRSGMT